MTIAVTTPSGHVGSFLSRTLVRAGVRPLLLPHRVDSVVPDLRPYVDVVPVDLTDADSVLEATAGVEALYAVVPPPSSPDPLASYAEVGEHLAAAVTRHRIRRTVFQSSVGAELRHGAGEIDGLASVEEALDRSTAAAGLDVVHLRCGFFYTNLLFQLDDLRNGTVPTVWPTDHAMAWVAPRDIAEVAASYLLRPDWSGRHVRAVHGPADLSWDDVMRTLSELTGHPVEATRISDDAMRGALAGAGMSEQQVEAMVGMSIGLRDGFTPEQRRDPTTTTETTFRAWAHDELLPALAGPVTE
ncbi:NmrA family NAD(P)-binding protein [Nocardioides sp. SYSU DS0651]|uniref:NmrA family NAD(P)-binding protein n=1 Tax=Nocardioides sp. SYSU DS0651 TaxID=3415955 RepID=UPI003F4AF87A